MLKFDDVNGNKHGILGDDADWVDFEMILSTDPDQIANKATNRDGKCIVALQNHLSTFIIYFNIFSFFSAIFIHYRDIVTNFYTS